MSKRVLSICLAVLIMAMAIPMSIFAPAVSAAQDGEINLSSITWPRWSIEKVIQNFDSLTAEDTDKIADSSAGGVVSASSSMNPSFVKDEATGNVELVGSASSEGSSNPIFRFFYSTPSGTTGDFWPTKDTKVFSIHIDATEAGKALPLRMGLELGTTSGSRPVAYALRNESFYFLPDATEENPNPTIVEKKTRNTKSVWNIYADIDNGTSGTYYFPLSMWTYDGTEKTDNPTYDGGSSTASVYEDVYSKHGVNASGIWSLEHLSNSNVRIDIRTSFTEGQKVKFDNVQWLRDPLAYNTSLEIEDFSDDTATFGYWSNNPENWATVGVNDDGKLAVKATETVAWGSRATAVLQNMGAWGKNAVALAYDVDVSEITHELTMYTRFYQTKSDGTESYAPWGNDIYLYGKDGTLKTVTVGTTSDNYAAGVGLPLGFNGTVIIPVESMRNDDDKTVFSDGLYDLTNLSAEIELKGFGTEADPDIDAGKSVYFDNFNFYVEPEAPEAGTTFSATVNPSMNIEEYITEAVKTTEVWVKSTSGGAILNKKFHSTGAAYYTYNLSVGVNAAGNPYYNISDGNGGKNYGNGHTASCTFTDVNVNTGEWTHLAFVQKAESIDLYVNSALAGSVAVADFDVIVNGKLTVGHTFNNEVTSKSNYFGGEIANLRLWNDVRTPAELYYNAVETPADTTGLIAGWNLNGETPFADISGKGNDIVTYDYEISADDALYAELDKGAAEGEYSFVFLPDTQIVNYHYSDQFPKVYDWVLENQDKYNIKAVMSLGDITDKNDDALDANGDGVVTREEAPSGEWARAREQFDRLTAAGIPWTIIPGNHDCKGASVGSRNYANLNQFFPLSEISQFAHFGGSFTNSSVVNSYYYLNVGNVKYLLLCLDQEPRANAIEWANQVVERHPDYRVIVTTHIYMTAQGVYYVPKGSTEPYNQPGSYTSFDTYESLWNGFLAKHANIDMVVCGHSSTPNILTRTDKGINGNDVLQVIVDTQQIDYTYASASCVAVATFSADGNNVRFRLYSTAQEMFLDEDSQFETKLEATTSEKSFVEKYPAADTMFSGAQVIQNFDYMSFIVSSSTKTSVDLSVGTNVLSQAHSDIGLEDYSLEGGALKASMPETDTETATNDYITAGHTFRALNSPLKSDEINAIALYYDGSAAARNYMRVTFHNGTTAFGWAKNATKFYTITDDGTVKEKTAGGNYLDLGKNFKGWFVLPFDNTFGDGATVAADVVTETLSTNAYFTFTFWSVNDNTDYYIDNICYLKNFDPNFIGTTEDTKPTNNVVLTDEITVNYKLDAADLETKGYTPTRAEFEVNGVVTNVDEFAVEDGKYVFAFNGVNPKNIADNITVTYFATKNGDTSGTEYSAYKQNYSVKEYCDNILANYTGDDAEQVKSVIKGMLNFSAASQTYFGYKTDSLANAGLDAADKELTFAEEEKPVNKMAIKANENGESPVKWKSAGLNFSSNVALRFNIEADDIEGLVVKAVVGDNTWFIPATAFSKVEGADNRYYVYFNKLSVACMRDTVDFTVYDESGAQVSDTLTYSIESYAAAKFDNTGAIGQLVKSMIKYGDAAKALNAAAAQ